MDLFWIAAWKGTGIFNEEGSEMVKWRAILVAKGIVMPITMNNDCAERSLGLVTDYHVDIITRSEKQKFHIYHVATELRSRMKKIDEKGLLKKLTKQINYLF